MGSLHHKESAPEGRKKLCTPKSAPSFCSPSHPSLEPLKRDAKIQLGTLGKGNHFLEFQSDDTGQLWLMVHTGSRAAGQSIKDFHTRTAAPLEADSPPGRAYLHDAAWATDYARANRRAILNAAAHLLHQHLHIIPLPETYFDCLHNFIRAEDHAGQTLFIHRKGANSARAGEPGIIPGSMATQSHHTQGRGCAQSLHSSSHGAGRQLSRDQARRQISPTTLQRQLHDVHHDPRKIHRLSDESPQAYKDIKQIMRAQRDLVKITRTLTPVLIHKGT